MMKTKINFLSLAFLLVPPFAPAWQPPTKVMVERVVDGDTLIVRSAEKTYSLRVSPIDAPEMSQTCDGIKIGEKARAVFSNLLPKMIEIEVIGEDLYGRILARLPQALQLVESGWALPYQRAEFSSLKEKRQYYTAFYTAFQARRGMWACKKLMNPLFYRKKFKSKLK